MEAKDAFQKGQTAHLELVNTYASFVKSGGDVDEALIDNKKWTMGDAVESLAKTVTLVTYALVPQARPAAALSQQDISNINPVLWTQIRLDEEKKFINGLNNK